MENMNAPDRTSRWRQILRFWFGDDLEREWPEPAFEERWFEGGPALDREITERFGRFPHRNTALSRESTVEEQKYLEAGSRFGQ